MENADSTRTQFAAKPRCGIFSYRTADWDVFNSPAGISLTGLRAEAAPAPGSRSEVGRSRLRLSPPLDWAGLWLVLAGQVLTHIRFDLAKQITARPPGSRLWIRRRWSR